MNWLIYRRNALTYETVIGLEVHAQLLTRTKIFCGCESIFGAASNSKGCPVCLGMPGSLPVLNRRVVEMAILMGKAVGCAIAPKSVFARKNYFYPDLPKGYQISQYDMPLCIGGKLVIDTPQGEKTLGITRIHLEEDAGKLIHDIDTDSLFDVNRCGTPLIEIVSEPDMRNAQEAYSYLTSLKRILEYLEISDCNMEEGSLRCDVNISLRRVGATKLGTKIELKNMNSFRAVERAIDYEVRRQADVLSSGGTIIQQTYLWDDKANRTSPMRTKEDAHDYRYFPDPDLVPLMVDDALIQKSITSMPELPRPRCIRFIKEYGLEAEHAQVLTESRKLADYFEAVAKACGDSRLAATWTIGPVIRIVNEQNISPDSLTVTPAKLAGLLTLVKNNTVSANAAKKVFDVLASEGGEPALIIESLGLAQMSDSSELEAVIQKIIADNPSEVTRYKAGDKKLQGFFVGLAMKATKGKGNPKEINKILSSLLGS
jgi:aspartyl-tRNA(Asn)/glutamyl-tRNA(Gln) amidotransferase subunit B